MANYIEQISSLENLMLAWRKLERAFNHGDVWFDELVISAFRMNLVRNLETISRQLVEGTYKMNPIQPIPFPKGGIEKDKFKVRQSFFIDFRDQLVWVAVCNVIGRTFDLLMPAWSYGNRQYVSMWKEYKDGEQYWLVGNHRNTSRQVYRKWTQSWPLMRKRITASIKKMARLGYEEEDETDRQVYADEIHLNEKQAFIKLKYLEDDYFPKLENNKTLEKLYWTGIDLTQFYQKVKMEAILEKIVSVLHEKPEYDDNFADLLVNLCHFEIDYSDYQYEGADEDLQSMQLKGDEPFEGLPTGLIVAGMLANIFMIDIDKQVSERLSETRDIIHFRYVDDHVIVSTSEEKLFEWIAWYQQLLTDNGLMLNVSKLAPKELLSGLKEEEFDNLVIAEHREDFVRNIKEYADLDPKYPTPLMTQTLQKVSMLQGLNLNLLSEREFGMVFGELQSLLVADLSEQEIKESTRISFACTMLTRLIVDGDVDYEKIHYFRHQWISQIDKLKANLLENLKNRTSKEAYDSVEKINKLVESCTNIIFHEEEQMDIDSLKKVYPEIGNDIHLLESINKAIKKGQNVRKSKERQVFNMLMHALDKVPDKVRIWVRAFHYCVRHEPTQIAKLYQKLDSYRNKKLHSLSVDFLIALLNTLCAENIIKATARLVLNDYKIPYDAEIDREFLKNAKREIEYSSPHFFVKDSTYLISKAYAFYNLFAIELGFEQYSNEESFFSSHSDYHNYHLDGTFWLLWAIDLLTKGGLKHRPILTKLLDGCVEEVKSDSTFFKPFFLAYLREVSALSATKMILPCNLNHDTEWLNQVEKYTISHLKNVSGLEDLLTVEDRSKYKPKVVDGRVNLIQWIDFVKDIEPSAWNYDLLNSEIMSVLIVLSVIKEIEKQGEKIDDIVLHPENFYIKTSELDNKWTHYISLIDESQYLDVKYEPNDYVTNWAYDYPKYLNKNIKKEASICYGLGIIFLQLLSKKSVLPWALNSEQVGFEWQSVLQELQGNGKISSMNYRILGACLSPRMRENKMLLQILGADEYVRESFRDNPDILNWMQLRNELINSLRHLRKNLISVADEEHRQLTIIDLE